MIYFRWFPPILACALSGCATILGEGFDPETLTRVVEQAPNEITYEYAMQWPSLLPRTAELAEQHCRANGGRSAAEFHRWGGGTLTDFVTYRCIHRV